MYICKTDKKLYPEIYKALQFRCQNWWKKYFIKKPKPRKFVTALNGAVFITLFAISIGAPVGVASKSLILVFYFFGIDIIINILKTKRERRNQKIWKALTDNRISHEEFTLISSESEK